MPTDTLDDLIGTLELSVSEILEKGAPDQRSALLKQSFAEFKAAHIDTLAKVTLVGGEPLYKGLGCVGRVAQLVQTVANQAQNIKDGFEPWGKSFAPDGKAAKGDDPASDTVGTYLDAMVHFGEMALRSAVNEHVELHDDDDDDIKLPPGYRLIAVPTAEAPNDDEAAVVVKTLLPEDLAKFATDPGILAQMAVEGSLEAMVTAGLDPDRLEKMFGAEGLAKAFGDEDEAEGGYVPEGEEEGADDEGDEGESPLEVAGRLAAALMLQLAHIQRVYEGGGAAAGEGDGYVPEGDEEGAGEGDAEGGESAGAGEGGQDDQGDPGGDGGEGGEGDGEGAVEEAGDGEDGKKKPFGKAAPRGDLAKRDPRDAEVVALRGAVAGLTEQLAKLGAQPAAPKAVLSGAVALAKESDGLAKILGGDGGAKGVPADGITDEALAKMSPEQRFDVEAKRVFASARGG